jgi:hypothetical protein
MKRKTAAKKYNYINVFRNIFKLNDIADTDDIRKEIDNFEKGVINNNNYVYVFDTIEDLRYFIIKIYDKCRCYFNSQQNYYNVIKLYFNDNGNNYIDIGEINKDTINTFINQNLYLYYYILLAFCYILYKKPSMYDFETFCALMSTSKTIDKIIDKIVEVDNTSSQYMPKNSHFLGLLFWDADVNNSLDLKSNIILMYVNMMYRNINQILYNNSPKLFYLQKKQDICDEDLDDNNW